MGVEIERIILSSSYSQDANISAGDDYTDVIVLMKNGDTYAASFFTFDKIGTLRDENQVKGEFLGGKYFWADHMILIDQCTQESVEEVVLHLLEEGDFWLSFRKL